MPHRQADCPRRVLAIGAHPDDAVLGAGAYLFGLADAGHELTLLSLTSGERGGPVETREAEEREAADVLGARILFGRLPDTQLQLDAAVDCIERAVAEIGPDLVLTHAVSDTHQDHVITAKASLIACRQAPCLYAYESPSSIDFPAHTVVEGTARWARKLGALARYRSQTSARPLLEWVDATGRFRAWPGHLGGYCEGLMALHVDLGRLPALADERLAVGEIHNVLPIAAHAR